MPISGPRDVHRNVSSAIGVTGVGTVLGFVQAAGMLVKASQQGQRAIMSNCAVVTVIERSHPEPQDSVYVIYGMSHCRSRRNADLSGLKGS